MQSFNVTSILLFCFLTTSQAFLILSQSTLPASIAVVPSTFVTQLFASNTRLHFRNTQDHEDSYTDQSVCEDAVSTIPSYSLPSRINLVSNKVQRAKAMLDTEILLGRVAMIAAVVLIGTELISGLSIPEQLAILM